MKRGLKPNMAKKISDRPLSVDVATLDIKALLGLDEAPPLLLTASQTARLLNISISVLAKSRMCGVINGASPLPPYVKIGNKAVRYRLTDILQWLDDLSTKQAV